MGKLRASSVCPGELHVRRIDGGGGDTTAGTQRNRERASIRDSREKGEGEKEGSVVGDLLTTPPRRGGDPAARGSEGRARRHGARGASALGRHRVDGKFANNPLASVFPFLFF